MSECKENLDKRCPIKERIYPFANINMKRKRYYVNASNGSPFHSIQDHNKPFSKLRGGIYIYIYILMEQAWNRERNSATKYHLFGFNKKKLI